jgi:hypothetical protein
MSCIMLMPHIIKTLIMKKTHGEMDACPSSAHREFHWLASFSTNVTQERI